MNWHQRSRERPPSAPRAVSTATSRLHQAGSVGLSHQEAPRSPCWCMVAIAPFLNFSSCKPSRALQALTYRPQSDPTDFPATGTPGKCAALEESQSERARGEASCVQILPGHLLALISSKTHMFLSEHRDFSEAQFHTQAMEGAEYGTHSIEQSADAVPFPRHENNSYDLRRRVVWGADTSRGGSTQRTAATAASM